MGVNNSSERMNYVRFRDSRLWFNTCTTELDRQTAGNRQTAGHSSERFPLLHASQIYRLVRLAMNLRFDVCVTVHH